MLDKQRQIIEEKLNQIITRLEKLYTKRDEAKVKVEEIKNLLSAYSKYCKAKSDLRASVIIYSCMGIIAELVINLMIDYFFPPVNIEFYSSYITRWSVTYIIIPLVCALTMLTTSFDDLSDIIRYRGASKIDEEEQNKELDSAEKLSLSINKQISCLEERKNTCLSDIKYIDDLPSMISKILDDVAYLTSTEEEIPNIEDILLSEFNDFLNEKVDYSKIHLDVVPDIKEYKLNAHK